jgi:hypothetical protein
VRTFPQVNVLRSLRSMFFSPNTLNIHGKALVMVTFWGDFGHVLEGTGHLLEAIGHVLEGA